MSAPDVVSASVGSYAAVATSLAVTKPSGVADGDVLVVAIRSQGSVTGEIGTIPSGWARLGDTGAQPGVSDRFQGFFYKYIPVAASESATTYTFGGWSSGRTIASIFIVRGADPSNIVDGGANYFTTAVTGEVPAFTAGDVPSLLLNMLSDERTSGWSGVPSTKPTGFTDVVNVMAPTSGTTVLAGSDTAANSRTALYVGEKTLSSSDSPSIAAASIAWPTGQSAPRGASAAIRGLPDEGYPVTLGDASTAKLTYLDVDGTTRLTPYSVNIWLPSFDDVADMLAATNGPTWAHRGGSAVWPEASEYAYDHAVFKGYPALEFSMGWSSDGVPFGLAYQYLDPAVGLGGGGTSLDPTAMTWAAISAYQNHLNPVSPGVYQPFLRLDDFAEKYSKTHICIVDPKYGFATSGKIDTMLDICDAFGGPDRFICKFDSPTTNTVMTAEAASRGYERMNYWASDLTAMAAQQSNWTIIGSLYSNSSGLAQAATYGKPVWAAIVPDAAGYATARTNGADFVMCTNPLTIPAETAWT